MPLPHSAANSTTYHWGIEEEREPQQVPTATSQWSPERCNRSNRQKSTNKLLLSITAEFQQLRFSTGNRRRVLRFSETSLRLNFENSEQLLLKTSNHKPQVPRPVSRELFLAAAPHAIRVYHLLPYMFAIDTMWPRIYIRIANLYIVRVYLRIGESTLRLVTMSRLCAPCTNASPLSPHETASAG